MYKSDTAHIKRERRKSVLLRELSTFIDAIAEEQPAVREVYLSRLDLSADGGICYLYFAAVTPQIGSGQTAEERYKEALSILKLYRPSLRKNLAQSLQARYTPDLMFLFDENREKIDRINGLLDQVSQELSVSADADTDEQPDEV
jgi:ribosome-binding factor A